MTGVREWPAQPTSRSRWVAGLLVGTLLWALAVFIAHSFPVIFLGRELTGPTYAIVALLFAPVGRGCETRSVLPSGCLAGR